jgi:hypothetical protein
VAIGAADFRLESANQTFLDGDDNGPCRFRGMSACGLRDTRRLAPFGKMILLLSMVIAAGG